MSRTLFVQLPLNPGSAMESTGNVPLAGASLAAVAGLPHDSVLSQDDADLLGDQALVEMIISRAPEKVCFTLYCWNVERSLYMAGRLKERIPGLTIVGGGPEVFLDNTWLMNDDRIDILASGEGEQLIRQILDDDKSIPSGGYIQSKGSTAVPGFWSNPYLTGHLVPGSRDALYIETVRGCSSSCIYCSYRRISPVPRVMPAVEVIGLLGKLHLRKTSEIVFIDPTFNDRTDLTTLLDGMADLGLRCFCELRGESIDSCMAERFRKAGFRSVEIGIQSFSDEIIHNAGRSGNWKSAMEGALLLLDKGVIPVLDLILGLPGEHPSSAVAGAIALRNAGLHKEVQVFFLSALPGTELRQNASEKGILWMEKPPYYVTSVNGVSRRDLRQAREEMANVLGYDLDQKPRPLLIEGWPGLESFDLDRPREFTTPLSFRHGVLELRSRNFWTHRERVFRHILRRRKTDPFCVLDVVLRPEAEFPLDLIDRISSMDEPIDYLGRTARFHGIEGNLRITVLLDDFRRFDSGWLSELSRTCRLVVDVREEDDMPEKMWKEGISIRLPGEHDLPRLAGRVPSTDQVFFRSWEMERLWTRDILGL